MKRKLGLIEFIEGLEFPIANIPAGKIIDENEFNRMLQKVFDSTALPKFELTGNEVISVFKRKSQTARTYGKKKK